MFSFFKKAKNQLPEWASFFKEKEYNAFIKVVGSYFSRKGIGYKIEDGVVILEDDSLGFNNLGLMNIAQICNQQYISKYEAIVSDHFDLLANSHEFDIEFDKIVHDYDSIEPYIALRLQHIEYAMQVGLENTIGWDFAGDIYAMLVFDQPQSVTSIKPEQAEKWGKSFNELFETGIRNIRNNYEFDVSEEEYAGLKIWFVTAEHFFTANIVFDLKNRPELIGTHGAIIGIPHRHAVFIYPINDTKVLQSINVLIPTVHGMCEEGPGSISDNLFWYNDGDFTVLPYTIDDKQTMFSPPQVFVDMLQSLATV